MTQRMHPDDLRAILAGNILSGMWACPADSFPEEWSARVGEAVKDADSLIEALKPGEEPVPEWAKLKIGDRVEGLTSDGRTVQGEITVIDLEDALRPAGLVFRIFNTVEGRVWIRRDSARLV